MKKEYKKPTVRAHKLTAQVIMTPGSGHHDNGNHHGWDNPHNPHYPGNPSPGDGDGEGGDD